MNGKIIACEMAYLRSFAVCFENEQIIRFRDEKLKDMYDHNVTFLKNDIPDLSGIIEAEIALSLREGNDFCNLKSYFAWDLPEAMVDYPHETTNCGIYQYTKEDTLGLHTVEGAQVKQITNQEMLTELLEIDLAMEEEDMRDFCIRRWRRRGTVYLTNPDLHSYLCYFEGKAVGRCDLFMHRGLAKIEDFAVKPSEQRQGYGTTIIKYLIDLAFRNNCQTIYLLTDEDETAKEMYQKIGFRRIGMNKAVLFRL
jgi:spore maturation protein CgeE